jgi:hypothetical protein
VGLRTQHFRHITEHWPAMDWFEILSENFIDTEGRPQWYLDRIAERYPIVMHGVSLSVGSTDPIDFGFLDKLAALARRVNARWLGDHICWTGVAGLNGHDLYPVPYTEEGLRHMIGRVRTIQDYLERPLVLENPSTYLTFASSSMPEEEFIARLAVESDCALLLDVNNVYVTCRNHDLDPLAYLDAIPYEHVVQVHLAGHTDNGTHCIDTHDGRVIDAVWELYARAQEKTGGRATLLEWDAKLPKFAVLQEEVRKAAKFRRDVQAAAGRVAA